MLKDGEAKADQPITATLTWDEWRILHLAAAYVSVRTEDADTAARYESAAKKVLPIMAGVERG